MLPLNDYLWDNASGSMVLDLMSYGHVATCVDHITAIAREDAVCLTCWKFLKHSVKAQPRQYLDTLLHSIPHF